jgi:hypothetical protein
VTISDNFSVTTTSRQPLNRSGSVRKPSTVSILRRELRRELVTPGGQLENRARRLSASATLTPADCCAGRPFSVISAGAVLGRYNVAIVPGGTVASSRSTPFSIRQLLTNDSPMKRPVARPRERQVAHRRRPQEEMPETRRLLVHLYAADPVWSKYSRELSEFMIDVPHARQ